MVNGTDKLFVLSRTTNYACVVKDAKSNQIFTVKTSNLPTLNDYTPTPLKVAAQQFLGDLFKVADVADITIRIPNTAIAPLTFDSLNNETQRDTTHPYLVIRYKGAVPCLAFPCTSAAWSPHITPMKMAILDSNVTDREDSLWTMNMPKVTAADLSRFATFPKKALLPHFQVPITTASRPDLVLAGIKQIVLCHTALSGQPMDECGVGELDTGAHEEELQEIDLVIGHFDVGEDNLPLPGAL